MPLDAGYEVQTDLGGEQSWNGIAVQFQDHNLYQTRGYGEVRIGEQNLRVVIVRRNGALVGAAQARITRAPLVPIKAAYLFWGPLWRRGADVAGSHDLDAFRQTIRAVRNEYAHRRRMIVRLRPQWTSASPEAVRSLLVSEGYQPQGTTTGRTIVMDIRPSLDDIQRAFHQKWRNTLNGARKRSLEVIEGSDDELFEAFVPIHAEMQERKQFVESNSPGEYRRIQAKLSPGDKMRVVLCKSDGKVCAGVIASAHGDSGIYLFGATSNDGMKLGGSYLCQWKILEWLKQRGCHWYNLNGINPVTNEGTYRFKARLAGNLGHDVHYLGQFDFYPNWIARMMVRLIDQWRARRRVAPRPAEHPSRDGSSDAKPEPEGTPAAKVTG